MSRRPPRWSRFPCATVLRSVRVRVRPCDKTNNRRQAQPSRGWRASQGLRGHIGAALGTLAEAKRDGIEVWGLGLGLGNGLGLDRATRRIIGGRRNRAGVGERRKGYAAI